jgi:hypothetical protein
MWGSASIAEPVDNLCLSIVFQEEGGVSSPSTTSKTATPAILYFRSSRRGHDRVTTEPPILCPMS